MKFLFFFLLMTSQAFAQDCFTRYAEFQNTEVKLAKTICVESVDLNLDYFGKSQATIRLTLDGKAAESIVALNRPISTEGNLVSFQVLGLDRFYEGGGCSFTTDASVNAQLIVNQKTKTATVKDIFAKVSESWDNCHSRDREVQVVEYVKVK